MTTYEMTPESLAIIKRGQAALRRIDKDKNWEDWIQVGHAVVECREVAIRQAGANGPYGRGYTAAYASLMQHYKFTEKLKDKGDRARLVELMENLPAITQWREDLSPDERRKLTHPTTVWRHWKRSLRKEAEAEDPDVWKRPSTKDQLKEAKAEIHELRKGAPLPWAPDDSAHDKARAIMEHLSIVEAEELGLAILQLVKSQRDGSEDTRTRDWVAPARDDKVEGWDDADQTASETTEATAEAVEAPPASALVWKDRGTPLGDGRHGHRAQAGRGYYVILPSVDHSNGYVAAHWQTEKASDGVRDLGFANSPEEAKAIAQAHHDGGYDRP